MDADTISNPYLGLTKRELNARLIDMAKNGHLSEINLLLAAGADVNATDSTGSTPLMWAVDHMQIVELLLARQANVNATDNNGGTVIMIAAYKGLKPVVELLIKKGAINMFLNKHWSTFSFAISHTIDTDIAFHLLSVMNSQEINELLKFQPQHIPLVNAFKENQLIRENANKVFNVLMPSWHISPDSPFSICNSFPLELLKYIRSLEAYVQDFAQEDRLCIKDEVIKLGTKFVKENKKTAPLIFSLKALNTDKEKDNLSAEVKRLQKLNLNTYSPKR